MPLFDTSSRPTRALPFLTAKDNLRCRFKRFPVSFPFVEVSRRIETECICFFLACMIFTYLVGLNFARIDYPRHVCFWIVSQFWKKRTYESFTGIGIAHRVGNSHLPRYIFGWPDEQIGDTMVSARGLIRIHGCDK